MDGGPSTHHFPGVLFLLRKKKGTDRTDITLTFLKKNNGYYHSRIDFLPFGNQIEI